MVMQRILPASTVFVLRSGDTNKSALHRAVRDANLLSYAMLFAIATVWLVCCLRSRC
jgi:hypothetical protein